MKEALKVAAENGFNIESGSLGITLGKEELTKEGYFTHPKNEEGELYAMNLYLVIYGTDFIKCLTTGKYEASYVEILTVMFLKEMSTIQNPEKLKEYVRGLL